ncbi:MAG: helix-turn-helix transcriptional regulator [Ruminococcaceae bacterium]|nr:helix-turn-helix transcriptional regulator [Oscillospiraceae bacterium]
MNKIKNRIRDLREDLDLRQIDVAKKTGIDQKTLSNYETGKTNPDSESIIKLAQFFEVSTDYLLGFSNSNFKSSRDVVKKLGEIEKEINEIKRFLDK